MCSVCCTPDLSHITRHASKLIKTHQNSSMELIASGTRLQGCAGMVMCHCKHICIFCLTFPYPAFQRLEFRAPPSSPTAFFGVFFLQRFLHQRCVFPWKQDETSAIGLKNELLLHPVACLMLPKPAPRSRWKMCCWVLMVNGSATGTFVFLGVEIWCKHLSCDQKENASDSEMLVKRITGWWFQIFFIFTPIWGRFPFWRIFFKGVKTHQLDNHVNA